MPESLYAHGDTWEEAMAAIDPPMCSVCEEEVEDVRELDASGRCNECAP